MLINGYKTSNNYKALFELMHIQSVLCYLDYNCYPQHQSMGDNEPMWDICEAQLKTDNHPFYQLTSRGYCYLHAKSMNEFIEKCNKYQVRFIMPTQSFDANTTSSLLELFKPIVFDTPEALHAKAKELDCLPYKGAEDIQYLHHIGGTLYKEGNRLFYFKKAFSDQELEFLVKADGYKQLKDKENFYISGNQNTGVLYVVENQKDQELK